MLTLFEIPLSPTTQTILVVLSGVTYRMTVKWCSPASAWYLDIADTSANVILGSVPLVTGVDLLGQYKHLGFGGNLLVATDGNPVLAPTFLNLGQNAHLYFLPDVA